MGVPKFYRWISERYPCLSEVVREYQIPEYDNLYLDMNGIIHNCSHPNDDDVHFRITEEQIFQDVFRYIEFLFRMIKPRKVFFMAIDGVAPRAKMNQQRGRRFRSAKEAETREKEAIAKGEVLPNEARFDSNCITPGTEFMDKLQQQLKYFVTMKMSTDELWKPVRVYLSGHETPGEGEHKIMDFIRHEKSRPDFNPNTRHCLYGLDADLLMLGLCSHEPHFSLLREEVKFLKSKSVKKVTTRGVNPDVITFHLLHLSLLRDYLDHEFSILKTTLPFKYSLESVIDDWILMGFLVGNDFIPHLPHFHINKNSLTNLYKIYMDVLPSLGGYMNENGNLNLERFGKFLEKVAEIDVENFTEVYADLKYFNAKHAAAGEVPKELESFYKDGEILTVEQAMNGIKGISLLESLEPEEAKKVKVPSKVEPREGADSAANLFGGEDELSETDSEVEEDTFDEEFRLHKKQYYEEKLEYENANKDVLKEQALCYVRAIQWNLHYYYNGCVSWGWYFPHHYAPYISDVKNFSDADMQFDMGKPFRPFEQLLAVLPAASKSLLPKAYQRLLTDERSPLIDFYPENFDQDMNEKQQAWEAVVKIPFIDETKLLNAAAECSMLFSANEKKRNTHGPHILFTHSEDRLEPYQSSFPGTFPDIAINHAKVELVDTDVFRIPLSQVNHGLCEDVRLDVHFPGFPTLRFIDHTSRLKRDKIKVFEMASNGENMILQITEKDEVDDIDELAPEYLGQSVFVNWPHLVEAQVVKVTDSEYMYTLSADNKVEKKKVEGREVTELRNSMEAVEQSYKCRRGIYVGTTRIALYALPITGRKYIPGVGGNISLEKQWSVMPMVCPLQTTIKDLSAYDPGFQQYKSIADIYPVGAKCFVLARPFYGQMAEVVDNSKDKIKVKVFNTTEPDLSEIIDEAPNILYDEYMPNFIAAQRVGVSGHVLSRLTGTVLVRRGEGKANIGLNTRFNARCEEVPGFSRKYDNQWQMSRKVIEIMEEYQEKFPEVFGAMTKMSDKDSYEIKDFFPGENGNERMNALLEWNRGLPCYRAPKQKIGAEVLDECVVKFIEMTLNSQNLFNAGSKTVTLDMNPDKLYRPLHYLGYSLPDENAKYRLFDRVINVRDGISVPLGAKGVIIGIHESQEREVNSVYDVLFDEEFAGGVALRCSPGRGYKMSPASLINLSYGQTTTQKQLVRPKQQSTQNGANGQRFTSNSNILVDQQQSPQSYVALQPNRQRQGQRQNRQHQGQQHQQQRDFDSPQQNQTSFRSIKTPNDFVPPQARRPPNKKKQPKESSPLEAKPSLIETLLLAGAASAQKKQQEQNGNKHSSDVQVNVTNNHSPTRPSIQHQPLLDPGFVPIQVSRSAKKQPPKQQGNPQPNTPRPKTQQGQPKKPQQQQAPRQFEQHYDPAIISIMTTPVPQHPPQQQNYQQHDMGMVRMSAPLHHPIAMQPRHQTPDNHDGAGARPKSKSTPRGPRMAINFNSP